MQTFKDVADLEAYKEHVTTVAKERFEALGLGPITRGMGDTALPPGPWAFPTIAAADGGKLILIGPAGSGKTTLLKKIAWGLALRRRKPRGGYIPKMLDRLKSGDIGGYSEWLNGGDILILDDLDKLRGTQYEAEKFLAMIAHYDMNNLPILVTMNVDMHDFSARIRSGGVPGDYAEAIISRLRSRSSTFLITGPDHRVPA